MFRRDDVVAAGMIRLQQTLGYSPGEIAALNDEYRAGATSSARTAEVLCIQIAKVQLGSFRPLRVPERRDLHAFPVADVGLE